MARHLLALVVAVAATVSQSMPARASAVPSSSYRCGWCPRRSTASLLPPDAGVLTGAACGYGDPAAHVEFAPEEGFHIAAVGARFFRGGRASGACYQLRCRDRSACAEGGVKVIIADVAKPAPDTNRTGGSQFQLTRDAFAALTASRDDGQVASLVDTAVDVDFRRIPCMYNSKNLAVRVEETSNREKGHLAFRFLYQGGQTDIVAVEVAKAAAPDADQSAAAPSPTKWQYMTRRRREGSPGVWRTSRAPAGPLQLRLVVTAGSGGKWLSADGAVLAAEWQPGAVYDTGLRVTEVAANTCGSASCAAGNDNHDDE